MSYADPNPYQSSFGTAAPLAFEAVRSERATFIRRTYAHLAGAVLAFAALSAILITSIPEDVFRQYLLPMAGGWGWLIFLGGFMFVSWIARSWAESTTSKPTQYAGLILFVVGESILFLPLLYIAHHYIRDPMLLPSAALITLLIFGGLTAIVFVTGADFSWMRMMLWLGGLAAMAVIFCGIIFGFSLGIFFSLAMVLLASGYILYDTSNILHHYRTDQHVAAALALFASVALLFWYVIQILMSLSGRD
jgi:FtsH-binding integral membrane protein